MENGEYVTTWRDRLWYGLYFFGQNVIWGFAGLIATFLTDVGFSPAAAAAILVGPKIWDAVNDTLFGYVVDKTRFRNGQKFLPWIRIGMCGILPAVVFMFYTPADGTEKARTAWFVVAYVLFDLFYTLLDAPAYALPTAMTDSVRERTEMLSICKFLGMLGAVVASVLVSALRSRLGWGLSSIVFCAIGGLFMLPLALTARETKSVEAERKEKFSLKQLLTYLRENDALLTVLAAFFLFGMFSIESVMSLYIARSCFGSESYNLILTACAALPMLVVSLLIPLLVRTFDKFWIMIGGIAVSSVFSIAAYFIGYSNILVSGIMIGLKCVGMAFWQVVIYMLISDTTEYGFYRTGISAEGMTFSLQTFVSKAKAALLNSFMLLLLSFIGFTEGENAVQAPETVRRMWALFIFIPLLGNLLGCLLLIMSYKLRDRDVQAIAKYNRGEIGYGELEEEMLHRIGLPAVRREDSDSHKEGTVDAGVTRAER